MEKSYKNRLSNTNITKRTVLTASYSDKQYQKQSKNYQNLLQNLLDQDNDQQVDTKEITVNDLFSFIVTEEQATKILGNKLHISKHGKHYLDETTKKLNKEGIDYFNQILHESIDFYERVFHEQLYNTYKKNRSKDKD